MKSADIKKSVLCIKNNEIAKYFRHLLWENENITKEINGINKVWQVSNVPNKLKNVFF